MTFSKQARRYNLKAFYNNKDMTTDLNKYLLSFSYTDPASNKSDSINITLHDRDGNWSSSWLPDKGALISINLNDSEPQENALVIENFYIDSISISGGDNGTQIQIGAVSAPQNDFTTKKCSNTWTNTTIKEIAKQLISSYSLSLVYDADEINIDNIEQNNTESSSFLNSLCIDYGLYMKIYSNKIIIFDREKYKCKDAIKTIKPQNVTSWSYNTDLKGSYTGAKLSYQDTDGNQTIASIGDDGRILQVSKNVFSETDAELKLNAALNDANHSITNMTLKTPGNKEIYASQNIEIKNFGNAADGKYYVDEVTHNLSGGYTCSYKLSKCIEQINGNIISDALDKLIKYDIIDDKQYWLDNYKDITESQSLLIALSSRVNQQPKLLLINDVYQCLLLLWKKGIIALTKVPIYKTEAEKIPQLKDLIIKGTNAIKELVS